MLRAAPLLLLLAACGQPAPESNITDVRSSAGAVESANIVAPTPEPRASTSPVNFVGRWTGVEGMYLDIKAADPGSVALEMQYDLDHKQRATGRIADGGIAFERDGKQLVLAPTNGAATGLKYLAGKTDCLTVAPGEGYCRD